MNQVGINLWITRPGKDGEKMSSLARDQGITPWNMPVIDIFWERPMSGFMYAFSQVDVVIVTSRHALTSLEKAGVSLHKKAAWLAVGQATADVLIAQGITPIVPDLHNSDGLLQLPILLDVSGKQVVILKGEGGRSQLHDVLTTRGARVTEVNLYRRCCRPVPAGMLSSFLKQTQPCLSVASSETLTCALASALPEQRHQLLALPLAVMSERIADFARSHHWQGNIAVAPHTSSAGLLLAVHHLSAQTTGAHHEHT